MSNGLGIQQPHPPNKNFSNSINQMSGFRSGPIRPTNLDKQGDQDRPSSASHANKLNTMPGNFQAKEEDQALLLTDHHLQDKAMASTSRPSTENHRIRTK